MCVATQIHKDMHNTLGDSASSCTTVHKWVTEFKYGRESLEIRGVLQWTTKNATSSEIVEKVHDMVMQDRLLKVSEIVKDMGI